MSEWGSKTVAELKKECKERGLKVSGTKAELVERIEEAIAEGNDTLETTGGNIEDELLAEVEEPEPEQSEETDELKTEDIIEEEEPKVEEEQATPEATPVEDEVAKKISRAERFGLESKEVIEQKKLSRAERFGLPAAEKAKTDEKKRARAERFGLTNANGTSGAAKKSKLEGTDIAVDPEKIKKRMERFGVLDDADSKKKARAARFAMA